MELRQDQAQGQISRNRGQRFFNRKPFSTQRGYSLLELIITITILGILAAAAIPVTRNSVKARKEGELRQALRDIREAIDRYKRFYDMNPAAIPIQERTETGYPKNLEILVEGFTPANMVGTRKIKFLRRLPVDPMTNDTDWGTRAFDSDPDSTSGGGQDVFDVYTKSDGTALNGSKYREW